VSLNVEAFVSVSELLSLDVFRREACVERDPARRRIVHPMAELQPKDVNVRKGPLWTSPGFVDSLI
jgi:hypothetical protein